MFLQFLYANILMNMYPFAEEPNIDLHNLLNGTPSSSGTLNMNGSPSYSGLLATVQAAPSTTPGTLIMIWPASSDIFEVMSLAHSNSGKACTAIFAFAFTHNNV